MKGFTQWTPATGELQDLNCSEFVTQNTAVKVARDNIVPGLKIYSQFLLQ